jgi:hypothetical protein
MVKDYSRSAADQANFIDHSFLILVALKELLYSPR